MNVCHIALTHVAFRADEPLETLLLLFALAFNLDVPSETDVFKDHRDAADMPERRRILYIRVGSGISFWILVERSVRVPGQLQMILSLADRHHKPQDGAVHVCLTIPLSATIQSAVPLLRISELQPSLGQYIFCLLYFLVLAAATGAQRAFSAVS